MWFLFGFLTISICITFEFWRRHASHWKPEGVFVGLQYRHERSKKKITTLLLGINCHGSPNFSIKRQSGIDSFFKRIGIANEFETGDASFDDVVYLISDNKTLHYALANSAEFRLAVKSIMDYGTASTLEATHIHCRNGRLWVQFDVGSNYADGSIGDVATVLLNSFDALKKSINEVAQISGSRWRDPFVFKAAILLAISSGLAINGAIHLFRASFGSVPFTVNHSLMVNDAILYALMMFSAFVVGAIFWLGRSARTHIVLIELLTVGAFGFFASTVVELRDINMEMDISAPKYYETQIVDKYTKKGSGRRSRSRTNYYVVFKDWNCDCGNYQLQVSSSLYRYLPGSGNVIVTQHQGRLGYPWVSNISTR